MVASIRQNKTPCESIIDEEDSNSLSSHDSVSSDSNSLEEIVLEKHKSAGMPNMGLKVSFFEENKPKKIVIEESKAIDKAIVFQNTDLKVVEEEEASDYTPKD